MRESSQKGILAASHYYKAVDCLFGCHSSSALMRVRSAWVSQLLVIEVATPR